MFFLGFYRHVVPEKGIGPGEVEGQRLGTLHPDLPLRLRDLQPPHEEICLAIFQTKSPRLSREGQARKQPLVG